MAWISTAVAFLLAVSDGPAGMSVDLNQLTRIPYGGEVTLLLEHPGHGAVAARMERFRICADEAAPHARGSAWPESFDRDTVVLLRGTMPGFPGSFVYLGLHETGSNGLIAIVPGGPTWALTSPGTGVVQRLAVTPGPQGGPDGGAPPLICATPDAGTPTAPETIPAFDPRGERLVEVYIRIAPSLVQLMGSERAAAAYGMQLMGAASAIFSRDVHLHFTLVGILFLPTDEPAPTSFNWIRLQLSASRDSSHGGGAAGELCDHGGGVAAGVAYLTGSFGPLDAPSVYTYDPAVVMHEIGHNCGAAHTHAYGLDECDDPTSTPRRGTIMSYCQQMFSGGIANWDLWFHRLVRTDIRSSTSCLDYDCNGNGRPDYRDIHLEESKDVNDNWIPDECEDCNGNGVLDPDDLAAGASDLNGNGVLDVCEHDCNGNGVPDDWDIIVGSSLDDDFNEVPDECETDCDGDGRVDYVQIIEDMALDLNRNAILDACEDCDGNGINDVDDLLHGGAVYVADLHDPVVREYLGTVGTLVNTAERRDLSNPHDLLVTPGGFVLVTSLDDARVARFTLDGSYIDDLVTPGSGGLVAPTALALSSRDTLLVASGGTGEVLEYDAHEGSFIGAFVESGAGDLGHPYGLAFGPDGHLYVSSGRTVLRYRGDDGTFIDAFVSCVNERGPREARGLAFLPCGNLLVASLGTNQVLEYDGATGKFVRQFNRGGTDDVLTLDQPWGIRVGPDGFVYVSRARLRDEHEHDRRGSGALHLTNAQIYQFHPESGWLWRTYLLGPDTDLEHPTGFDFAPAGADCNRNLVPDSCDIARGTSADRNDNGKPDECEVIGDLDGDGVVGPNDLLAVLAAWGPCEAICPPACAGDVDSDCIVDVRDVLLVLSNWG